MKTNNQREICNYCYSFDFVSECCLSPNYITLNDKYECDICKKKCNIDTCSMCGGEGTVLTKYGKEINKLKKNIKFVLNGTFNKT